MNLKYSFSFFNTENSELKTFSFFNEETLLFNYTKLDTHLQRSLEFNEDIDERCFLRTRQNLTPIKFTPFQKQGELNKFISPNFINENHKRIIGSSRTLNYDTTLAINSESKLFEFVNPYRNLDKFIIF